MKVCVLVLALSLAGAVQAHEGDSEERGMRLLGQLQQLDRNWAALTREADAEKRRALLLAHAQAMRAAQETLRDAAEKSPCILLEANDPGRQLACLVDTEARLRATERVLGHVINRQTLENR